VAAKDAEVGLTAADACASAAVVAAAVDVMSALPFHIQAYMRAINDKLKRLNEICPDLPTTFISADGRLLATSSAYDQRQQLR
jgi:hypothetical protein